MSTKKYSLQESADGSLRIVAEREGPWGPKGTIGGFVSSDKNLSHTGDCWIYDNAGAYGNSRVRGNATLYNHASVRGNAIIKGAASIRNRAYVLGSAIIEGHAVIYDNARIGDNAKVTGFAQVHSWASVQHDAIIRDKACVTGCAIAYGEAILCGKGIIRSNMQISRGVHTECPLYMEGTRFGLTHCGPGWISVGGVSLPYADWGSYRTNFFKKCEYTEYQKKECCLMFDKMLEIIMLLEKDSMFEKNAEDYFKKHKGNRK